MARLLLPKPGASKLRPASQIRPSKPFHPARETISIARKDVLSILKKQFIYETCVDMIESNITRNNHIAVRKMSGPRNVV